MKNVYTAIEEYNKNRATSLQITFDHVLEYLNREATKIHQMKPTRQNTNLLVKLNEAKFWYECMVEKE